MPGDYERCNDQPHQATVWLNSTQGFYFGLYMLEMEMGKIIIYLFCYNLHNSAVYGSLCTLVQFAY